MSDQLDQICIDTVWFLSVDAALLAARAETARPSLILVRNHIGYGSPNKHDSFALGEDGPTHQSVEQLAALRSIPNLTTLDRDRYAPAPDILREYGFSVENVCQRALALVEKTKERL